MTIRTIGVGAAVTPAVIKTAVSHYTKRNSRRGNPTNDISYDQGLHLIRAFLDYASHHSVDDLQQFTSQWVPSPRWVRTEDVFLPDVHIREAAELLIQNLGPKGIEQVGGSKWWQWRGTDNPLKAEWIEMRSDYNNRKRAKVKCRRVMLYVHGGAYFFGSVDEHRYQMQRHARKLKARVFAPRYRLAPQFPFPCGLHDCLAAYLYLLTIQDPTEIVLAGDSAGGGMLVSMLCILRDQGLPLPAGAILISPWVDLTHSFPSLSREDEFDYIPRHGFMHKPSMSWPPPNDDEIEATLTTNRHGTGSKNAPRASCQLQHKEAVQGFTVDERSPSTATTDMPSSQHPANPGLTRQDTSDSDLSKPTGQLSIEIDGDLVVLKDQIQMYATNQLIVHPLVSPVLQPSLGGLPPLLILTGGGEMLRDEQIYLAHKAADPDKYSLSGHYKAQYDPEGDILRRYKPTFVQLQVWDDLCHVAPTLSFTRPAKFMYRSIAQFGAWALARAQHSEIEIVEYDDVSAGSTDSEGEEVTPKGAPVQSDNERLGTVGIAGDGIPPFKNYMIRQRVDRNGNIFPLPAPHDLPGCALAAEEVGIIKPGPVTKWMAAKKEWDTTYAGSKRRIQRQRLKELEIRNSEYFGADERPPPSALAGRRKEHDARERRKHKSMGLAMWSRWGSKHDEEAIRREEEETVEELNERKEQQADSRLLGDNAARRIEMTGRRTSSKQGDITRSRSRRAVSVVDQGQTEQHHTNIEAGYLRDQDDYEGNLLTPMFLPKFKNTPHIKSELRDMSDALSTRTGISMAADDNASTNAVFASAGIVSRTRKSTNASSLLTADKFDDKNHQARHGADTPGSRRSLERLQDQQSEVPGAEKLNHVRNASGTAVFGAEGVATAMPETLESGDAEQIVLERPTMYDRKETAFQTAAEGLAE